MRRKETAVKKKNCEFNDSKRDAVLDGRYVEPLIFLLDRSSLMKREKLMILKLKRWQTDKCCFMGLIQANIPGMFTSIMRHDSPHDATKGHRANLGKVRSIYSTPQMTPIDVNTHDAVTRSL